MQLLSAPKLACYKALPGGVQLAAAGPPACVQLLMLQPSACLPDQRRAPRDWEAISAGTG